jgi:hypothetical protein
MLVHICTIRGGSTLLGVHPTTIKESTKKEVQKPTLIRRCASGIAFVVDIV